VKIQRIRVDLIPKERSNYLDPELNIEVRTDGNKVYTYKQIFTSDDFESLFDRMMERATRYIKEHHKE
jgi:hypothetical protein